MSVAFWCCWLYYYYLDSFDFIGEEGGIIWVSSEKSSCSVLVSSIMVGKCPMRGTGGRDYRRVKSEVC
jgi:hypothetical protein